jgi:hypothetical protein
VLLQCFLNLKLKIKSWNSLFDKDRVKTATRTRREKNNSLATFSYIPRLIGLGLGWILGLGLMGQNMSLTILAGDVISCMGFKINKILWLYTCGDLINQVF